MGILIRHNRGSHILRKPVHTRCYGSPITEVLPSNCWAGQTCFIIGGGPSLSGFDWSQLKDQKVIGINKAFIQYPVDINFGIDYRFFEILQYSSNHHNPNYDLYERWRRFEGYKVFVRRSPSEVFAAGIHYVPALNYKAISFDLSQGIYPGSNSGVGAILLAVGLGCKRIGLLGYVFKIRGNQTHWHTGYSHQTVNSLIKNLDGFRRCVDEWADGLAQHGIKVVNLSSDSNLQNYPRSDFRTFLEEGI